MEDMSSDFSPEQEKSDPRPANLDDDEKDIRDDEDYRVWCRADGQAVVIRGRKIYLQPQVMWIFDVKDKGLNTLKEKGLKGSQIGITRFSGRELIRFLDTVFAEVD